VNIPKATKNDLFKIIEDEGHVRIDSFVESAVELAEEVHSGLKREDGQSSFLETHIWPVAIDVIRHYKSAGKLLTTLQIVSSILHDVLEDDEKILDQYASKSYGFEAYFRHRFGEYVYNVATNLKAIPLNSYQQYDEKIREHVRFQDYCTKLVKSSYDVKVIKLADRLNNMNFVSQLPNNDKVDRYVREAEDFYIAFTIIPPSIGEFYFRMRHQYDKLRNIMIPA
jgi:(p)ppGpp synthase/HD superfamily hydrolase